MSSASGARASGPGSAPVGGIFEAFAHPVRARVLARVAERPSSPSEMAREFGEPIGVVSYHARRLEALGLARVVKIETDHGRRGPPRHCYGAAAVRVSDGDWLSLPPAVRAALTAAALRELASRFDAGEPLHRGS